MRENFICVYSSLLYIIPAYYLLFYEEEYFISYLLILLAIFAAVNHTREYCDKPYYDVVDLIDRILIVSICTIFIWYYCDCFFLWYSGVYLIVSYYLLIPRLKIKYIKVTVHSTIHLVTAMTAFMLTYLNGNRMKIEE